MTWNVVIDTSCLVSAALRSDSIPDRAVRLAMRSFQLCTGPDALRELEEVLQRKQFDRYASLDARIAFLETIRAHSQTVILTEPILKEVRGCCRDEKDEFILALALTTEADAIVSSDHDLLVLHPWRGISILTPAQFITEFLSRHGPR